MTTNEGSILRFFVNEEDRYENVPLYHWIVLKARENGISGACAFRGLKGFGAHRKPCSFRFFRSVQKTPVVVELVDGDEKLSSFLQLMQGVIAEGLAAVSEAEARVYSWSRQGAEDP